MPHIKCKKNPVSRFTFIVLILTLSIACQTKNKRFSLSMESAISPAYIYESTEDRNLIIKYQNNLKNIYNNVRSRYKPDQLEFYYVSGICFRKLRVNKHYKTYLSLNTKSSKLFIDTKKDYKQRLSIIYNHYLKPLLKIAAVEREMLNDVNITGIMINTQWNVKKSLKRRYDITLCEQVSLVTLKEHIDKYLEDKIADQELLDLSTFIAINEGENPRIIKLILE